jgi:uncharacterized protein (DUF4415 family)
MDRVDETVEDDDEVSFAPAPSPNEARARLAALRGKPLQAPSRLAVVSEEERAEPIEELPTALVAAAPASSMSTVSISLPADKIARLFQILSDDKPVEAPKAEPQKPARAAKTDKPLFKPVKVRITTRVDADVLEAFKATGPGWQTLMNDVLRENMPTSGE